MKDQRITKIEELLSRIIQLSPQSLGFNPNFDIWYSSVERTLIKIFGKNNKFLQDFQQIFFLHNQDSFDLETYKQAVMKASALLITCINEIEDEDVIYPRFSGTNSNFMLEDMLHAQIKHKSYPHYLDGDYRNAVLDSVIALFDYIREKSGLTNDGEPLIENALSLNNPKLILSNITTESGKNDQLGFMSILKGVYKGIRNPKAHTLNSDLDNKKTAEYLVFISLLIRRIEEARIPTDN